MAVPQAPIRSRLEAVGCSLEDRQINTRTRRSIVTAGQAPQAAHTLSQSYESPTLPTDGAIPASPRRSV
jgi:hypothetical protein